MAPIWNFMISSFASGERDRRCGKQGGRATNSKQIIDGVRIRFKQKIGRVHQWGECADSGSPYSVMLVERSEAHHTLI
jgi:hypothetical protein